MKSNISSNHKTPNQSKRIKVGITIGDINGIGPELLIKAFQHQKLRELFIPIVYGSSRVINIYRKVLRVNRLNYHVIQNPGQAQLRKLNLIECLPNVDRVDIGRASRTGAGAALASLDAAIADAQHQEIQAIVTLPVDKSTLREVKEGFIGHTEMLAEAFNVEENLMMMVSDDMRVGLVTNHLPISLVPQALSEERIIRKIKMMASSLRQDFNIPKPKIAVLGLNPHAGDSGLIGEEEQTVIKQAIEKAKGDDLLVLGPYPADGFFGTLQFRNFDGVLAMYHDQGLIPFKLLSGFSGVNFTSGIPIVRTSPDHGVAYDIAGKGEADPESFLKALYLAIDVYRNRTENQELAEDPLEIKIRK